MQVEVDNDANLGALGEATFGAARGIANMVYVKIATGIGAGLVLDGRLFRGGYGDRRRAGPHRGWCRKARCASAAVAAACKSVASVPTVLGCVAGGARPRS